MFIYISNRLIYRAKLDFLRFNLKSKYRIRTLLPRNKEKRRRFHLLIEKTRTVKVKSEESGLSSEDTTGVLTEHLDRILGELDIF